jgi:hypothetical protein
MILDKNHILAGSYAGSTGTWTGQSYSTFATAATEAEGANVYDTQGTNTLKDLGSGEDMYLMILVTTSITSGGAANVTFKLGSDATTTIAGGTVHWTSGAIAKATLVAGWNKIVCLPREKTYERYLGITITPDTSNLTAGAIVAVLAKDPAVLADYAKAYTIQ